MQSSRFLTLILPLALFALGHSKEVENAKSASNAGQQLKEWSSQQANAADLENTTAAFLVVGIPQLPRPGTAANAPLADSRPLLALRNPVPEVVVMGKGDRKTKKGKIWLGTTGNTRPSQKWLRKNRPKAVKEFPRPFSRAQFADAPEPTSPFFPRFSQDEIPPELFQNAAVGEMPMPEKPAEAEPEPSSLASLVSSHTFRVSATAVLSFAAGSGLTLAAFRLRHTVLGAAEEPLLSA